MGMWLYIIGGMALATLAFLIFLITRVMKFAFLRRITGPHRVLRFLAAALITALFTASLYFFLDVINTSIVLVHVGVIWIICDLAGYLIRRKQRPEKKQRSIYMAGVCAVVISLLYMSFAWYCAHHVWHKTYDLSTDKEVGTLRVIGFADSHTGTTFHGEGFRKQVEAMQAYHPDVVVVAGDYVDDDTMLEDMTACCEALGTLETTYGVYYVFGNHDEGYYNNVRRGYSGADLVRTLKANNVTVLEDETVLLDNRFYLIGRKDRSAEQIGYGRMSMEELVRDLDPDKYMIVLDHQPNDYQAQEASGVDLVFSGHTHGGQFFPINYLGEWTGLNDKTYGLYHSGNTDFIVTSGISDWAIKFKTGCVSEFVIMDIEGR